jgi:hypothetical protein
MAVYFAPLENTDTSIVCWEGLVSFRQACCPFQRDANYFRVHIISPPLQSQRCETVESVAKLSVLLAAHLPQHPSQMGAANIRALTHIVVSYSQKTNFVLEKQGMQGLLVLACPPPGSMEMSKLSGNETHRMPADCCPFCCRVHGS